MQRHLHIFFQNFKFILLYNSLIDLWVIQLNLSFPEEQFVNHLRKTKDFFLFFSYVNHEAEKLSKSIIERIHLNLFARIWASDAEYFNIF